MTFLQQLQNQKNSLRNTETIVTYPDGTRYTERHSGSCTSILSLESSQGFVTDLAPDDVPALIIPCLYLGSQDCCNPDILLKYNIESVLSIGIEAPYKQSKIFYKFLDCLDMPETQLKSIIKKSNQFIKQSLTSQKNILVHCNAGVSRSVSIVIGYLILEEHKTYEEAYNIVKAARCCMQPNIGFIQQLKILHQSLH